MPKASSTERVRAFRQRQRGFIVLPKKIPKSGAQRAREFRARRKALKAAAAAAVAASNLPEIEHFETIAMPSTSNNVHEHGLYDTSQPYTNFRDNCSMHEELNDKLWVIVKEPAEHNAEEEYIISSGEFPKDVHNNYVDAYNCRSSVQHGENCCKQCFSELREINLKILKQQHEILQLLKNSKGYHVNTQSEDVPFLTPDMIKEELTD